MVNPADEVDKYIRSKVKSSKWLLGKYTYVGVITEALKMRVCKLWPMQNKHCMGVNHGKWKINIAWVNRQCHFACVEVLRLYKILILADVQFPLAVPISNSSLYVRTLFIYSSVQHVSSSKNKKYMIMFLYIPRCLSTSITGIQHQLSIALVNFMDYSDILNIFRHAIIHVCRKFVMFFCSTNLCHS